MGTYTLMEHTGQGPNSKRVAHSGMGDFKQDPALKCDTYVRKMCLTGDYTLYSHAGKHASGSGVDMCDHSFQVAGGDALKFHANAAAECTNTELIKESGHAFSLLDHKAFIRSRNRKYANLQSGDEQARRMRSVKAV